MWLDHKNILRLDTQEGIFLFYMIISDNYNFFLITNFSKLLLAHIPQIKFCIAAKVLANLNAWLFHDEAFKKLITSKFTKPKFGNKLKHF